ncbi:hypothetical protein ZWY2020_040997 [Hordeum vulgare]|nr:hypothetical protein ZWY2020_040997 [Hordeum vulgare]
MHFLHHLLLNIERKLLLNTENQGKLHYVLMKLCLLYGFCLMGQVLWGWQNGDLSFTALDMESRLSKVEAFKKTTRMLQVQLDILDKKLGDEIGKAKRDITKQFDDKGKKLETKIKTLDGKAEILYKSLTELRDLGFVSNKEFEEILTHLKIKKECGLHRPAPPKDFQVSGWYQGADDYSDKQPRMPTSLGEFTYDLEKSNAQTFQLDRDHRRRWPVVNMVRSTSPRTTGSLS